MMKRKLFSKSTLALLVLIFVAFSTGLVIAQTRKKVVPKKPAPVARRAAAPVDGSDAQVQRELNYALALAKHDYVNASLRLFNMTRNPRFSAYRTRIKYVLGLMFFELKMYQVAAFQFVDVVRTSDPKYIRQALRKLSLAADILNDDTLINYAIGKVNVDEFPAENQDMLRYRLGEYQMRKSNWEEAANSFSRVPESSPYYPKAKYLEGLAQSKRNDLNAALKAYSTLADFRKDSGATDTDRVAAHMGMARVYYQGHKWDQSIDEYREIPRDTEMWHDALFESSWANIRAARFRSVLSNLHSLHSPYYEDFYLPESILLRGIVYLYICQYDEMEKTLDLFQRIYQPVQNRLQDYTTSISEPGAYFTDLERIMSSFESLKTNAKAKANMKMPFLVAREIMREGDFRHIHSYIGRLRTERNAVNAMPGPWRRAPIGLYSQQLLKGRIDSSTKVAGNIIRAHMLTMKQDLADMFEQYSFGRYEMLNGKKEQLKKKIAGKGVATAHVDDAQNRDFYIQNGYQYYPFTGEYWLDEIGDYHYLGTQGCE